VIGSFGLSWAKEAVDETATRMTARVIRDIGAHVLGLIEVEDRPASAVVIELNI